MGARSERQGSSSYTSTSMGPSACAGVETGHYRGGVILIAWNCLSMLAAAVVLAASSPQMMQGALVQGLPPLVFLLGAAYTRLG